LRLLRGGGHLRAGQRMDGGGLFDRLYDAAQRRRAVSDASRGGGGDARSHGAGGEIKNAPPRWGEKLRIFCNCFQTVNKGLIARVGSQNGSFIGG